MPRIVPNRHQDGIDCCESCGNDFDENEAGERYDGDWLCENCINSMHEDNDDNNEYRNDDSHSGIHSYSYKPATRFYTLVDGCVNVSRNHDIVDVPVMGIELEVENVGNGYLNKAVEYINSNVGPLVYLKEDCSISHGFEIVSHPMSLDFFKLNSPYKNMLEHLRTNGYHAWKTSSCGLHIHISKQSFIDAKHQMKFLYFMFKNKKELIKFSGRNSSFAKYDYDSFINNSNSVWGKNKPNIFEIVKGVQKDGNYVPHAYERNLAVNRMNDYTHELRIFRPSLRYDTVLSYVEFVECLFAYTKQVSSNEILKQDGLKFVALLRFAMAQNDRYSAFVARVAKRKVLEKKDGE